jgi:hypothetical protein
MKVVLKVQDYDIVVLPIEGRVLGRLRKDGSRREIFTSNSCHGYHTSAKRYPEARRARLIWVAVHGPIPEDMQINHINHNRADDRISNLELVTRQQNNIYRKKRKYNCTNFTGVYFNHKKQKYESRLGVGGKHIYIGYYFTAEEAARAYDEAAREWAGKHAILNFPNHDGDLK